MIILHLNAKFGAKQKLVKTCEPTKPRAEYAELLNLNVFTTSRKSACV